MLQSDPGLVNLRLSGYGWTPLHVATKYGHVEVVRLLIQSGAKLDATERIGWSPLIVAAYEGHVEVVRLLLKSGAKTNLVDTCGMTARDRASSQKHHTVIELFDREIRRQRFQMFLLGTLRRTKTQDKPSFVSTLPVDVLEMIAASVL
eukprot:c17936_g1_i2.p1 GENE.c17936_g1_i2~~c17936_g1_i2.p1  ORF type:complete len:148 (+),score=27.81 c17936_g1_i2:131-574(+)